MGRIMTLIYGVGSYAVFFLTFLYAIGFLGNVVVPKSLDSGPPGPLGTALADRHGPADAVRRAAQRHGPPGIQAADHEGRIAEPPSAARTCWPAAWRSILLFWQWRPLGGVVWEVQHPVGRALLLRRLRRRLGARPRHHVRHQPLRPVRSPPDVEGLPGPAAGSRLRFVTPVLYRVVRHPLYVGWLLGVLEHADDDRDAPALCGRDHGLHPRGDSARRTRSDGRASRVRGLSRRVPMLVPAWRQRRMPTDVGRGGSVVVAVMTDTSIARTSFNFALATVGWGAVGLGTAGLFITGLPTTVLSHRVLLFFQELATLCAVASGTPLAGAVAPAAPGGRRPVEAGQARGTGRDVDIDSGVVGRAAPRPRLRRARHDCPGPVAALFRSASGPFLSPRLQPRRRERSIDMTPHVAVNAIERDACILRGPGDAFSGYAVIGLPFQSGHVLALRRFSASSPGPRVHVGLASRSRGPLDLLLDGRARLFVCAVFRRPGRPQRGHADRARVGDAV